MLVYCVTDPKTQMPHGIPVNTLITYFGMRDKQTPLARVKEAKGWRNLFLDCGAFAADNAKKQIDLDAYSEYCKRNAGAIDVFVALDIRGKMPEAIRNYRYMKDRYGLKPVPVFPVLSGDKDQWKYLEELMSEADMIAFGNLVGRPWPKAVVKAHLDKAFALNVKYRCRIHSFGYTARWAMVRYPFYSMDTARWSQETAWWRYYFMDRSSGRMKICQLRQAPPSMAHMEASKGLRQRTKHKHTEQIARSAMAFHEAGAWLTEIWAQRGVMWDDDMHRRAYPDLMNRLTEEVKYATGKE